MSHSLSRSLKECGLAMTFSISSQGGTLLFH